MTTNATAMTYTAADEIDRRLSNRSLAKAQKNAGPATPEGARLLKLSAAELTAEVGLTVAPCPVKARKPAKAPAPAKVAPAKPARTKAQRAHTEARKLAYAHMIAEKLAGNKCTYAEACATYGTVPATKA